MNCSQSGYATAATQGHLSNVGTSSSTGSRRRDAFKQDCDTQQVRSFALNTEETVDQMQETLAKSLSTQDQVRADFEKLQVGVHAALSHVLVRLDVIERELGLKSAPAADLENSGEGPALIQCIVPTTVIGAALRNNKLIKPSAPATFPESGKTGTASTQTLSKASVENESGTDKVSLPTSHMKPEIVESGSSGKEKGEAGAQLSTAALKDKLRSISLRTQSLVKPKLSSPSQGKDMEVVKLQMKSLPVQASTSSNSTTAPANDIVDGREAIAPINSTSNNIHPKSVMASPPSSASAGLPIPARPLNNAQLPRMVKPSAIQPSHTTGRSVSPPATDIDSAKAGIGKLFVTSSELEFEEVSAAVLKLLPVLKEDALRELAIFIFATFAKDSGWASVGGRLCKNLCEHPTCGTPFRNLLIERSQKEFVNVVENIGKGPDSSIEKRTPGLIWFLAEIYMMVNVRKIDRFERIFLLALATVELMNILLSIHGACHLKANILCTVNVLKHMKPCLITDGAIDEGIVQELGKLGQQCKRLESSGASSLNAELKSTLQSTHVRIKLMMNEVARGKTGSSVSSPPIPK